MEKDYVSFELAKKLKEKGFREECLASYCKRGGFQWNSMKVEKYLDSVNISWAFRCFNNIVDGDRLDAPTIAQVLKWLRGKKIYVDIEACPSFATVHKVAFIATVKLNSIGSDMDSYCMLYSHRRFEDAAVDGIEYVLDNLI